MARDFTIGITIAYKVRDEASKPMSDIEREAKKADTALRRNIASLRELGRSALIVGGGMLGLAQIIRRVGGETGGVVARVLEFGGGLLVTVGTISIFISAIIRLIKTLKELAIVQTVARIIAGGPFGLAANLAVIAAALGAGAGVGIGITKIAGLQHGGIVTSPMIARIGEAGPEAVIPLSRAGGFGGGPTVIIQAGAFMGSETDARKFAQMVARFSREELRVRRAGA
jgi:hypothetical protein